MSVKEIIVSLCFFRMGLLTGRSKKSTERKVSKIEGRLLKNSKPLSSERKKRLLINGAPIPFDDELKKGSVHRLYVDGEFIGLGVRGEEGLHVTVCLGREDKQEKDGR